MNILISGATGFVGSPLVKFLKENGHKIYELVYNGEESVNKILWNIDKGEMNTTNIPDIDVVINLAGENIAQGRWNKELKEKIWNSRIEGTKLIIRTLNEMGQKPDLWINASAVGYYGIKSNRLNSENSPAGEDFLAKLCVEWEKEANKASGFCKRVVIFRFGMILDKSGGALAKMLPLFEKGLGGSLGRGKQNMCWVALVDILNMINFAINHNISGVFNAVSPGLVTNKEFTKALGKALGKLAILPVPKLILKLIYGEMAEALLLPDIKASPLKIMGEGYEFREKILEYYLATNLIKS